MNKPPKFLSLNNEAAAPGRKFILHTGSPAFLAEVFSFDTEQETIDYGNQFMALCEKQGAPCLGSKSRKPWNGKHYFFAVISIYEGFTYDQKTADRLARITRRMADWYMYNVLNNNKK